MIMKGTMIGTLLDERIQCERGKMKHSLNESVYGVKMHVIYGFERKL